MQITHFENFGYNESGPHPKRQIMVKSAYLTVVTLDRIRNIDQTTILVDRAGDPRPRLSISNMWTQLLDCNRIPLYGILWISRILQAKYICRMGEGIARLLVIQCDHYS